MQDNRIYKRSPSESPVSMVEQKPQFRPMTLFHEHLGVGMYGLKAVLTVCLTHWVTLWLP